MSGLLNDFMNEATKTGTLSITPVRIGGATPVIDLFVQKMDAVMRRVAPQVKITFNKPSSLLTPASNAPSKVSAAKIAGETAKQPALMNWGAIVDRAASSGKAAPDHVLHEFATLHAQAYSDFGASMAAAPGQGRSIASTVGTHAYNRMQVDPLIASDAGFSRCIDSVYMSSFADAYAAMKFAAKAGTKHALEMIEMVRAQRQSNGEFDHFSQSPQSADSDAALKMVEDELKQGTVYGGLGRDNLVGHAMGIAAENVGQWLTKHGAPNQMADAMADTITSLGAGMHAASIKLAAKQQHQATVSNELDPMALRNQRSRMPTR